MEKIVIGFGLTNISDSIVRERIVFEKVNQVKSNNDLYTGEPLWAWRDASKNLFVHTSILFLFHFALSKTGILDKMKYLNYMTPDDISTINRVKDILFLLVSVGMKNIEINVLLDGIIIFVSGNLFAAIPHNLKNAKNIVEQMLDNYREGF